MIQFNHEDGLLTPGMSLQGVGYFPHSRALVRVRTRLVAAQSGRLVLALEVGGLATGVEIDMWSSAPGDLLTPSYCLDITVPPNSPIRWVCQEGTFHEVLLVVEDGPFGTRVAPDSKLTLEWVDGFERFAVADYIPETRQFVPNVFAAGRCSVTNSPSFELVIGAQAPVLYAAGGALNAAAFNASGGTGTEVCPRIEFWIGRMRVASVLGSGTVLLPSIEEATPVAGLDRFCLQWQDSLLATIGPLRLVCPRLEES